MESRGGDGGTGRGGDPAGTPHESREQRVGRVLDEIEAETGEQAVVY